MAKKLFTTALIMLLLASISLFVWSASPRDCENCGSNCEAGDCDESDACAQCQIAGCMIGGEPHTVICNQAAPH